MFRLESSRVDPCGACHDVGLEAGQSSQVSICLLLRKESHSNQTRRTHLLGTSINTTYLSVFALYAHISKTTKIFFFSHLTRLTVWVH